MRKILLIAVVVIIVVVGVRIFNKDTDGGITNSVPAPVLVQLSELNNSGQSGTVAFAEENGKAKVFANLTGAGSETQPAHIHMGTCADSGAVVYPVNSLVNGQSETVLDASLEQIKGQLPLIVNVHKSVSEASVYVACGEVTADSLMNVKEIVVVE